MKIFIATLLVILIAPIAVSADADHSASLEDVLAEILQGQDVGVVQDIDCGKITDGQFEELGDAWMERMHAGQAHEFMDQMMGGEGSASLRSMHIQMGSNYLGCGSGGFGMMSGGMMGGMMGNLSSKVTGLNSLVNNTDGLEKFSMMGFPFMGSNFSSGSMIFGWLIMILFWVFVILGIVWLVKFLASKNSDQNKPQDALGILKERYAKGEISQKEFETMKKNIN